MRFYTENPAQKRHNPKISAVKRQFSAFLVFLLLLLFLCPAWAEDAAEDPEFDLSSGDSEFAGSLGDSGMTMLTEDSFNADDIPAEVLESCASPGRVEKVKYRTTDGEDQVKSVMVYLPAEYDAPENAQKRYDVLYILHASSGRTTNYLDPSEEKDFQRLLDNMIANGELEPLIAMAASYYPTEGFTQFLPLAKQVEVAAEFPRELVEDVIPAAEAGYRTYAASVSAEDIEASRDHRAIAGFSLGGTTTWYVFLREMKAFKWFLPISEASWADADGGTSGIWDSDVSAKVLYDAVKGQGFEKDDFRLFVATGTDDEAFDVSTSQMVSLLEYADMFKPGENTSCSMMNGGTHTLQAVYTYLYHILPALFQN